MIEDALDISLHGELEAHINRHLEHCAECRAYLSARRAEHIALFEGVNRAYSHMRRPPADLARRIAREVKAKSAERRGWRRLSLPRWALVAASLVALAGFVFAATAVVLPLLNADGARGREYGQAANAATEPPGANDAVPAALAAAPAAVPALKSAQPKSTVEDAVEVSADTNIVVEAGDTLKIEYVYGDNPVTVTKSGGGRLEIATSSITNLSVVIAEGAFASARPAAIPLDDTFRPSLRLDASDADTFTVSQSNGTNFLTKVVDADGNGAYFSRWSGWGYPYVAAEKLNGLGLIDFGTMKDKNSNNSPAMTSGNGGMFAFNNIGPEGKSSMPLGDFFFVWKDRDDSIDHELIGGKEFTGPNLLGNNPGWFVRGDGGGGNGFTFYTVGMHGGVKEHIHLDGQKVNYDKRVPRGFHLLRNRVKEGSSVNVGMIGYTSGSTAVGRMWTAGGFVLAEAVIYSNRLSEATAKRVEAQLQSKWLGMKLNALTLNEGAELDVSAFKFSIGTMDISGTATVTGETNLCFKSLVRTASAVAAAGTFAVNGGNSPLLPDIAFDGDAMFDVAGTSRVQTVSATSDRFVKTGAGELRLVDPVMSNITVLAGTLSVSPLYVRSAEYHLDANAADTISWTESDGKKLVSQWRDMEDASRLFKPTSYRKYSWNSSLFVRGPYVTANAAGDKPMMDFGTFANANHQEGWGGCLEPSLSLTGLHDVFAVWQDHPEVKDYTYGSDYGTDFYGPCIFGLQYYWFRGTGGNGSSFAMHHGTAPDSMYKGDGLVWIDGVEVEGKTFRTGDGIHVYSQRISGGGAPIEQMGGAMQAGVKTTSESTSVQGTYGGLMIGEVLMFKECLTDRLRMRISGALNAKWRGATNEWAYGEVSVAAGATLNHPFADLVADRLELGGTLAAKSVKVRSLALPASGAVLDGELELGADGVLSIGPSAGAFGTLRANGVRVAGEGIIAFIGDISTSLCGQSFRIVETENVSAPGITWKAPSLRGSGLRAVLSAKEDGLYVTFSSSGFVISFK